MISDTLLDAIEQAGALAWVAAACPVARQAQGMGRWLVGADIRHRPLVRG